MNNIVMPRVAVIGAGAVGCTLAARLAAAGCSVTVGARGASVNAIRDNGVRLICPDGEINERVEVAVTPDECGPVDVVIIAVKQQDLESVATYWLQGSLASAVIVPAVNGVPWWFLSSLGHRFASAAIPAMGQGGRLHDLIPLQQIVACVVYVTAYSAAPGIAVQGVRNALLFGEPVSRPNSPRTIAVDVIVQACTRGGFQASASADIHSDIWVKAIGNAVFNPLSVLAQADMQSLVNDPYISEMALQMLHECVALGLELGIDTKTTAIQRLESARSAGNAQTSMLQDYLKGRPLEVEALVGAMVQIAEVVGVPLPYMRAVYGLTKHHSLHNPLINRDKRGDNNEII